VMAWVAEGLLPTAGATTSAWVNGVSEPLSAGVEVDGAPVA